MFCMTDSSRLARPSRHVRTQLPGELHERLKHLAVDLDTTIADLLTEAIVLLLRYHGHAQGLREPTAPTATTSGEGGR